MIPSWARVGAKVVCIKRGKWSSVDSGEVCPSYGDVLTIRRVSIVMHDPEEPIILHFREIKNIKMLYDGDHLTEFGFHISRFRPLIATKTQAEDVALFMDAYKAMDPIERCDLVAELLDEPETT